MSVSVDCRLQDFKSEFGRLLHVLAATRMTASQPKLVECYDREHLDQKIADPLSHELAPLFKELKYKPEANAVLAAGVTLSDVCMTNPALGPHVRDGGLLKRKFGYFIILYGTCLSCYRAFNQGEPEVFRTFCDGKTYIMYAFCLLKQPPILHKLAIRALSREAQREERVGRGIGAYGCKGPEFPQSNKTWTTKNRVINVRGVDRLVAALLPPLDVVSKELLMAER